MKTFGLIGYPLGHSFSKSFFENKFKNEHIDAQYLNFEIPTISDLTEVLNQHPNLMGFNITIPYKQDIISFLSDITPEAKAIGAVNVVRIEREHTEIKLIGHNSDIYGFVESLKPLLKPQHTKALVLGTGGASKAVIHGLESLGISYQYVSRKHSSSCISYDEITPSILQNYKLIINCTPLGMHPHIEDKPAIDYNQLTTEHLLYDLVYNPEQTAFLKEGIQRGSTVKNGLEMLHLQALKAWDIWNK